MRRPLNVLVLVVLTAATLAAALATTHRVARAADPVTIAVSPATANATVGDDVALDITAANVPVFPGLGGYLILLEWNPAVLTLTSLTDSGWVTSGQIVVICTTPAIDNVAGNASADCTPVFGVPPGVSTSAPRALAQAVFHPAGPGSTAINLTGSNLLDPSNVVITSTLTGGSVTVSSQASVGGIAEPPDLAALPPRPRSFGVPPAAYAAGIAAILALLAVGSRLARHTHRR